MKFLITGFFIGLVFLFFLQMYRNDIKSIKKGRTIKDAIDDKSIIGRGTIYRTEPNGFSLSYYDLEEKDSHYDFLNDLGYQGGGPSWLGIVYGALKLSDPHLIKLIDFDDEGDGLVINAPNKDLLEKVSRLIQYVKENEHAMIESIQAAEIDDQME